MPCTPFTTPEGARGFICTTGRGPRCSCGGRATKLCDWKDPKKRNGTCSKPLCARCTHVPAPDKDLCPDHAHQWRLRLQARADAQGGPR